MELKAQDSIQFLKGVGEKRSQLYKKLGISTVTDLLYHLPRAYIDLTNPAEIISAPPGEDAAIRARVIHKSPEQRIRKGLSVFKVTVADDTATLTISFFNVKYTVDSLKLEEEYFFYGKVSGSLLRREMSSPQVFPIHIPGQLMPVYPQTAGLTSKIIGANIRQALAMPSIHIPDPIPDSIRQRCYLCTLEYALENIHFPKDTHAMMISRKRFIFEELFIFSLAMASIRGKNRVRTSCPMKPVSLDKFLQVLPFTPTEGQLEAIGQIGEDLCKATPMSRLVQGDVGCGKTLVAAAAAYMAAENGFQAAMMAPTEILAEQHLATLEKFLSPLGIETVLLTGSMGQKQKRLIKEKLKNKEAMVCVGTHALLTEDVEFSRLGLVITDEQHRFGVAQRTVLSAKGENPHVLVMSATPIPRTLALILYGDLDISVIKEMPKGRLPVKTYAIGSDKRERAFHFIHDHLKQGFQAYIVCPLIETGEVDLGLKPALEYAEELKHHGFADCRLGVLHGKMKAKEKEQVMADFKNGEIQLLVSTTVIEVGVDVPNAVIMMIEDAHRFGLSQLHQLRGRVGRGSEQSHCILVSDAKGEEAIARLKTMCRTNDGFQVAEFDLAQRGPGDFLGHRQHGMPEMRFGDMSKNLDLLQAAQEQAAWLIQETNGLKGEEYIPLRRRVRQLLEKVGENPN